MRFQAIKEDERMQLPMCCSDDLQALTDEEVRGRARDLRALSACDDELQLYQDPATPRKLFVDALSAPPVSTLLLGPHVAVHHSAAEVTTAQVHAVIVKPDTQEARHVAFPFHTCT